MLVENGNYLFDYKDYISTIQNGFDHVYGKGNTQIEELNIGPKAEEMLLRLYKTKYKNQIMA